MKSSFKNFDAFKIHTLPSNPTKISKKKVVTFKKSVIKCPENITTQVETSPACDSINIELSTKFNKQEKAQERNSEMSLGPKTGIFSNKNTPRKQSFVQKKSSENFSQNYSAQLIKSKKELVLEMFKQNISKSRASSVNSIIFDDPFFFSFGRAFLQKKFIRNTITQECPFEVLERQIQKTKEIRKKNQSRGLQKIAKKLLNDLSTQQKFGNQTIVTRQRYLTFFHSRIDKKPFREISLNRQRLEKSHQHKRSKSIDCEIGSKIKDPKMIKCVNDCTKLMDFCKQVQKEQKLKKQIKLFTVYSKNFAEKCEKKFKHIDKIKRAF